MATALTNATALGTLDAQRAHTKNASIELARLSTGRQNPFASQNSAAESISAQFGSEAQVLLQARTNAINGANMLQVVTSAIADQRTLYTTMKTLAVQAASGDIDESVRGQLNVQFLENLTQADEIAIDTNWNGLFLMNGGATTGAATIAAANAQAANGLVASGTDFTNALGAATKGFISGTADAVRVNLTAANTYDVELDVRNGGIVQTFVAKGFTPTNDATVSLVSNTDSGNIIQLTQGNDTSGMTSEATVLAALQGALGLGAGATKAQFVSLATAANNGVTGITTTSAAKAGTYALSYVAGEGTIKLTGGTDNKAYFTDTVANLTAATYDFGNGISVAVDATFASATAITQMIVDVDKGGKVSVTFQVGANTTDTVNVDINDCTNAGRGISSLSIDTVANAQNSINVLSQAIKDSSSDYSTIGAKQGRLEITQVSLETSARNLLAAKANYSDTDIAKALTQFTIFNTMAQVANVATAKSLEENQQLLSLANKV